MGSFLLIATVYLATMVAAVPVSARLGLGSVLGYLVAGILIGPVMGLAGSAGQMADLQHFAEVGVVMMLGKGSAFWMIGRCKAAVNLVLRRPAARAPRRAVTTPHQRKQEVRAR